MTDGKRAPIRNLRWWIIGLIRSTQKHRREFLKPSAQAGAALSLGAARKVAANDKVLIALMGAGGRGNFLLEQYAARPDVEVAYII
jgi:hypothetical protein